MKIKLSIAIILTMSTFISEAIAGHDVISRRIETFKPERNSLYPELEQFEMAVEQYRIFVEGDNYGTRAFFSYKTKKVNQLEKFGIVQFIRGCQFLSTGDDRSQQYKDVVRKVWDENGVEGREKMIFPNWTVDSIDPDPMYNTHPFFSSRHFAYRWNSKAGSFDKNTGFVFGEKAPLIPSLYVSDRPGNAFFEVNEAFNISLDFKSCIFKKSDIPANYNKSKAVELMKSAIHCFDWQSHWVYNYKSNKMRAPNSIEPVCLER